MEDFIKRDKLYHLIPGILIGVIVTLISDSSFVGFLAAFWAGALKEIYDYPRFDWKDWLATAIGGLWAFFV